MDKQILVAGVVVFLVGLCLFSLTQVYVGQAANATSQTPTTVNVVDQTFPISNTKITNPVFLSAGEVVNIAITVTGGTIDFSVNYGTTSYVGANQTSSVSRYWVAPRTGNYQFVYDNSAPGAVTKTVKVLVTNQGVASFTSPTNASIPQPLIPAQFNMSGLVLMVMGAVVIALGLAMGRRKAALKGMPLPGAVSASLLTTRAQLVFPKVFDCGLSQSSR